MVGSLLSCPGREAVGELYPNLVETKGGTGRLCGAPFPFLPTFVAAYPTTEIAAKSEPYTLWNV
jgi:hypothetical protein